MARHDWKALKAEFINGDVISLSAFFRGKKIAKSTWERRTKGWIQKRDEVREKVHERATQKSIEIQASRLAKRAADAQEMMDDSMVQFRRKKGKLSARQSADVFKIASEVQDRAMRPLLLPQGTGDDQASTLAVGVEISGDELKSIRVVAKSIANAEAGL